MAPVEVEVIPITVFATAADLVGMLVWWSTDHTYKNAITNELFLLTSAAGYLRTRNETYLDNANKVIVDCCYRQRMLTRALQEWTWCMYFEFDHRCELMSWFCSKRFRNARL
jgi:hypothetical protein